MNPVEVSRADVQMRVGANRPAQSSQISSIFKSIFRALKKTTTALFVHVERSEHASTQGVTI